jgi:hypothetical protein
MIFRIFRILENFYVGHAGVKWNGTDFYDGLLG